MRLRKSQVKAVLFDLGGTLVKTAEIPQVIKKILLHHGIHRTLKEISQARIRAEKGVNFQNLARLLGEFWIQWNLRILTNLQIKSNTRTLAEFIATHWWDHCDVTLYPDAAIILPLIKKRGLKMGIVTNGLQSDVDEILPKVRLQNFFDVVVVIDTMRKMKPDVEVFHYALETLKIAPSEAIFIGDDIERDYKGAERSGLTAYLIDRDGKAYSDHLKTISRLDDLVKLGIIK